MANNKMNMEGNNYSDIPVCGIRFLTIYHRKIIEYLIRGRLAKVKS